MTCRSSYFSRTGRTDEEYYMRYCAEKLLDRSVSTREAALQGLVDGFRKRTHYEFHKNKTIILVRQLFLSCIRGSAKEKQLASSAIGFLTISVGLEDGVAHEILGVSTGHFSVSLRYVKGPLSISSLLDCLAVVTVVGGRDTWETERSMRMIWEIMNPVSKTKNNDVATQPDPDVLRTAIYAWSFLLTTINVSLADGKIWKQSLLYFSNLLEHEKKRVRLTAAVAIAHIFETGYVEKFCSQGYAQIEEFKGDILKKIRNFSVVPGDAEEDNLRIQHITCPRVSDFLEDGNFHRFSTKIGKHEMEISSWSKYIQITFLKGYLGVGFATYLEENEVLHDLFDLAPMKQIQDPTFYCKHEERMFKSPNSIVNKARTKLMNKKRTISMARNFPFGFED